MSKYRKIRCYLCKGIGIIKKVEVDSCSHCEFKLFRGPYEECGECLGVGEHLIDNNTNQKVLAFVKVNYLNLL